MDILSFSLHLVLSGVGNLASYLAAHVLLCLLPAFFIAGAMTALIPKETITRFLGRERPKYISYPAAALAGSVLAVCSCTIVPLFAGIYKKGAGLGPAITFLFFAPAANILALIYTGGIIGVDLALARLLLSLAFGIGIGLIMALIFRQSDKEHDETTDVLFASQGKMQTTSLIFLLLLIAMLLAGTLKISLLSDVYASVSLPISHSDELQIFLHNLIPFDPARGGEGVSAQGALLILLLSLIGITAWKGIESVFDGFNYRTWTTLLLLAFTLLIAADSVTPQHDELIIHINGRSLGVLVALLISGWLLKNRLTTEQVQNLLWESWKFVKQIFPLLVIGVFLVGGGLSIFVASRATTEDAFDQSELQENGRIAMRLLTQDLKWAGFWGDYTGSPMTKDLGITLSSGTTVAKDCLDDLDRGSFPTSTGSLRSFWVTRRSWK